LNENKDFNTLILMKNHYIYSQQLWLSEWMRGCRNKRKWRKAYSQICFCCCSRLRVNGNNFLVS
jgi:hypothetical protein